jgi:PAS domain S-box-containing protein
MLDVISSTGDAAFASNDKGSIVLWNEAAKRLLGYSAGDVLGRRCFEVIGGIDTFGNRYCRSDCNLHRLLHCRKAVCPFQMHVRKSSGEYVWAAFRIVLVSGQQLSDYQLVHLMQQIHPVTDVVRNYYSTPSISDTQTEGSPRRLESSSHLPKSPLTNRECEVLGLLALGSSTAEISKNFHISVATVRNHVQNILRKLAVHSKLEAVSVAHRNHLI